MAFGLVSVPVAPAAAAKRIFGKRPLHQGMHGRDVRVLQDYLTRAGFKTAVDGQFGRGTASKVRAWETEEARAGQVVLEDADVTAVHPLMQGTLPEDPFCGRRGGDGYGHEPAGQQTYGEHSTA